MAQQACLQSAGCEAWTRAGRWLMRRSKMMDQTAHCMSTLPDPTCCCRGMGSATVSHPEVADDKCSAALDVPKVASLPPTLLTWTVIIQSARADMPSMNCKGNSLKLHRAMCWSRPVRASCTLRRIGISIREWVLCAGGNDVPDARGDPPGAAVGAVVPAPGWPGACVSPEGEPACDCDNKAWRPVWHVSKVPRASDDSMVTSV